jgi:hypothetical protein
MRDASKGGIAGCTPWVSPAANLRMNEQNTTYSESGATGTNPAVGPPIRHNLNWRDLRHLLVGMGDLARRRKGGLTVTRSGHTLFLEPGHSEVGFETIVELRQFIVGFAAEKAHPGSSPWVAIIDHLEIRIFHADVEGRPFLRMLKPIDRRKEHGASDFAGNCGDPSRLFAEAALAFADAPKAVLSGNDAGGEREQFMEWLESQQRHPAGRLLSVVLGDGARRADGQQLAAIRAYCEGLR